MNADALITLRSLWCSAVCILKTYLEFLKGLKEFSALSAMVVYPVNENTTQLLHNTCGTGLPVATLPAV